MPSKFSKIKDELINNHIYATCIVDNEFAQYMIDSDDLDKDLNELESSLAEYLDVDKIKVKIYNISIIENLRPSHELEQDLRNLPNQYNGENDD